MKVRDIRRRRPGPERRGRTAHMTMRLYLRDRLRILRRLVARGEWFTDLYPRQPGRKTLRQRRALLADSRIREEALQLARERAAHPIRPLLPVRRCKPILSWPRLPGKATALLAFAEEAKRMVEDFCGMGRRAQCLPYIGLDFAAGRDTNVWTRVSVDNEGNVRFEVVPEAEWRA